MKRSILSIIWILLFVPAIGQNLASKDSAQFTYCEIKGTEKFLSSKLTVEIDFGQFRKYFSDKRYKDPSTGKPINFNSMIDALNFMGKDGWNFVQAYAVTEGTTTHVYHYLMRKQTSIIRKEESAGDSK